VKILIASDWYVPVINGVVTSVLNLKKGLEERGHEVRVLTLSNSRESVKDGSDIYRIGSVSANKIYPNARVRVSPGSELIDEIISWAPDVIHTQCEFSTFITARRIARELEIPIVHTYHTIYEDYTHYFHLSRKFGGALARTATGWVSDMVDCIIAPTGKVRDLLKTYSVNAPVRVIPTGIDIERFARQEAPTERAALRAALGLSQDAKVLVSVCRLAAEKNIEELLRCFAACRDKSLVLVIVGDGPHRGSVEKEIRNLGLEKRVKLTGMITPKVIPRYYRMGDLFVCSSTSEAQGLTYIESLAAGLPVLCKRDECLDGLIVNGKNGWQYDAEQEFADLVDEFFASEDKIRTMAANAIATSQLYSIEVFAQSAEEAYLACLGQAVA